MSKETRRALVQEENISGDCELGEESKVRGRKEFVGRKRLGEHQATENKEVYEYRTQVGVVGR